MKTGKTMQHILRAALPAALLTLAMTVSALAVDTGVITGDVVNARKGPGTSYALVETLAKGKRVTILAEDGDWFQITWNESKGYVHKNYVSTSGGGSTAAAAGVTANATVSGGSSVNVRTGPGTEYSRITTLGAGKRVAVLETSGSWYKISFDGKTGYIMSSYVTRDGAAPAAAPAVDTSVGNATVRNNSVNVRTGPSTDYSRIATVNAGKRVTIVGKSGTWLQIEFDGKSGYVYNEHLAADAGVLASIPAAQPVAQPAAEPAAQPAAEPAAQPAAEQPAAEAPAEQSAEAAAAETTSAEAAAEPRTGIVTGGTINVRAGAGTEFERLTQVSTGKRVTILAEENGWVQVSFDDKTGYIHGDYIFEGESLPASSVGEQIAAMAQQYLGVRYVHGGSSPSGFDCSGLTAYLYRQFGYSLPHTASGQYANCGYKVSRADLQPGDLVYFTSPSAGGRVNHTAVYIGGGQIVHARYSVGKVYLNSLSESYYTKNYVGAIRIV